MGLLESRPETVPVIPCSQCGEAHTVDWCTHEDGKPKKPNKRARRKRLPRFSVAAYDPELAMKQLEKYYPGLFSLNHKEGTE